MESEEFERQKAFYAKCWCLFLGGMLDWTPLQCEKWTAPLIKRLDRNNIHYFAHESPVFYVAEAVIPAELKGTRSALFIYLLQKEIAGTMEKEISKWMTQESYDWQAARYLVQRCIQEYVINKKDT